MNARRPAIVLTAMAALAALTAPTAPRAWADPTAAWPADAVALEGAALEAKLVGKVFRATDAQQRGWRFEYTRLGHVFVDVGASFKDHGPYRVDGNQVCVTLQRTGASCNEYRVAGETVYFLRSRTGELMTLQPQ